MWPCPMTSMYSPLVATYYDNVRSLSTEVACLHVDSRLNVAMAGTGEGEIIAFRLDDTTVLASHRVSDAFQVWSIRLPTSSLAQTWWRLQCSRSGTWRLTTPPSSPYVWTSTSAFTPGAVPRPPPTMLTHHKQ